MSSWPPRRNDSPTPTGCGWGAPPRAGGPARGGLDAAPPGAGLRMAATSAAEALAAEDLDASRPGDVLGLLAHAKQVLDGEREHDAKLAELADRAGELGYLAADLAGELSSYVADVETDPARLA